MGTTKRLRTKDEELAYRRIMVGVADCAAKSMYGAGALVSVSTERLHEIAKMVSDDIKRMARPWRVLVTSGVSVRFGRPSGETVVVTGMGTGKRKAVAK